MPISIWPPALPQFPLRSGWRKESQDNRWSFEPDQGPIFLRKKGGRGPLVTMEFLMDDEQLPIFENYVRETLAEGALAFEYDDPASGKVLTVRLAPGQGWSVTPMGVDWKVSMVWEVMP